MIAIKALDLADPRRELLIPIIALSVPAFIWLPTAALAVFFLLLTLLPLLYTVAVTREFKVTDPLLMVCVVYGMGFPLPVLLMGYLNDRMLGTVPDELVRQALVWSYRGFVFFVFAFLIFQKIFLRNKKEALRQNESTPQRRSLYGYIRFTKWVGLTAIVSTFAAFILDGGIAPTFMETGLTGRVSSMRQFVHHLSQLGYGFFLIYWMLRMRSIRERILDYLFYVLFFQHVLIMIGAGAKIYFFSIVISALLALNSVKYTVTLKKFLLLFLLLVFIFMTFSVVSNFRMIAMDAFVDDSLEFIEVLRIRTEQFKDAVVLSVMEYRVGGAEHTYGISRSIIERLSAINSFSKLIQFTDATPPYENAINVFMLPFYTLIPSSLFPEKPHFFDSGDFAASMFGMKFGGISVTLIGSLYWCWGYAGICLGMALVGAFFAFVEARSIGFSTGSSLCQVLFIILLLHLIDTGRTFQSIVIDLLRTWFMLMVLFVVARVIRSGRRSFGAQ